MNHPTSGPGTIVVAVDGSPASVAALRYARHLGDALHLRLIAVIATDDREPWDWSYPYQGYDPLADAARHLDHVVDEAFAGEVRDDVQTLALRGRAVPAITSFARDASLLVVGNRGHGPLLSALLGSVTTGCAAHATCPVVVVPTSPATGSRTPPPASDAASRASRAVPTHSS